MNAPISYPAGPLIRRVALRTRDATGLAAYYQKLLGLLPQADPADAASVSLLHPVSGDAILTLVDDQGARPAPSEAPGLFHVAFLFPGLEDWRRAVMRAMSMPDGLHGASDHGVSWAVYLADPDGNGIELAWDKPENEWPWHGNRIRMVTRALPLRGILLNGDPGQQTPGAFSIGHLHLQVADLQVAKIYQAHLGLHITQSDFPGALFLARDHYHHHFAINTWRAHPEISRPDNAIGLVGWDMTAAAGTRTSAWLDPYGYEVTGGFAEHTGALGAS